ncbi:MAG: response regulator [Clostridia bacterium]|nr:response regulator [Clostridia bacterium]
MDKLILVVDDEVALVDILKFNLTKSGYKVICAYDGEEGYRLAITEKPDLILLDVMLPKMEGFEVCRKVREKQSTPIIMVTARDEEVDKVLGLELGADDYITKPYSIRELLARVKANLRRNSSEMASGDEGSPMVFGKLTINPSQYEVEKDGVTLDLTLREFELIKFIATEPGKIFSRETLLEKVWGYEYFGDVRTVDVTVRRLREKVEDNPASPLYIMTKRGVGYYFNK